MIRGMFSLANRYSKMNRLNYFPVIVNRIVPINQALIIHNIRVKTLLKIDC